MGCASSSSVSPFSHSKNHNTNEPGSTGKKDDELGDSSPWAALREAQDTFRPVSSSYFYYDDDDDDEYDDDDPHHPATPLVLSRSSEVKGIIKSSSSTRPQLDEERESQSQPRRPPPPPPLSRNTTTSSSIGGEELSNLASSLLFLNEETCTDPTTTTNEKLTVPEQDLIDPMLLSSSSVLSNMGLKKNNHNHNHNTVRFDDMAISAGASRQPPAPFAPSSCFLKWLDSDCPSNLSKRLYEYFDNNNNDSIAVVELKSAADLAEYNQRIKEHTAQIWSGDAHFLEAQQRHVGGIAKATSDMCPRARRRLCRLEGDRHVICRHGDVEDSDEL
eukprot:PhM_4_TR2080/c5_g1_i3/m.72206